MANPEIPPLDVDIISQNHNCKRIGRKVVVYSSTTSTNNLARQYAKDKDNDGLVIFAEEQTAGKGRFNNKWHSNRSESILCSILLIANQTPGETISMACAVAVAQTIDKIGRHQAKIKWPNDITINDKKIAGILIESEISKNTNIVIIGIGINCHQQSDSFPAELRSIATSIDIEMGSRLARSQSNSRSDRNVIAKRLLHFLDYWLDAAITEPQKLTQQWQQLSSQIGKRVTLVFNSKQFTGSCIGIDPENGLILQLETGGIRFFDSAHSSIAK